MNLGSENKRASTGVLIPTIIGVGLLLIVGGLVISTFTDTIFPVQASAESKQVDELFRVLLGIGGSIFLLVEGLLLFSVLRYRVPVSDRSDGPTIHGNVTLEMIWTAIPSLIVLGLVIYSYQVWVDVRSPKDNEMEVHVTGARFAWTFSYTEDRLNCESDLVDERLDCANSTINPEIKSSVLHLYAGRPVKMIMNTQDVIHSFWVPEMRIKQDLLPGRTTEVRFTPELAGEYNVVCAELCGSGHGNMRAQIIVHPSEEDYLASFIAPAVEAVVNPPDDPVLLGGALLASGAYPCAGCHTLNDPEMGIEWAGLTGPVLNGIADRAPNRVAGQSAEEYLYTTLHDPGVYLVPGFQNLMPQFQGDDPNAVNFMSNEAAQAIVAYLCTVNDTHESVCDLENLAAFSEAYHSGS